MYICIILTVCAVLTAGMVFPRPAYAEGTASSGTWTHIGGAISPQQSNLHPAIAVSGGVPFVAYNIGGGYAKKYANGSWSAMPEIRPGNYATNLSLQVYNNTLYAGYLDGL